MKKIYSIFIASAIIQLHLITALQAQSPQRMNYQAVARDASGNALASQQITARLTIHNNTPNGAIAYIETDTVTTNPFGLFTISIGGSTTIPGGFSGIAWGSGNKYLQVEMDPAGGSAFTDMGTTQLLSVPYALYAETTASAPLGQSSTNYYGTGYTFVSAADTAYKLITGLSQSITVPTGVTTLLQSTGSMYGTSWNCYNSAIVALFIDGVIIDHAKSSLGIVTDDNISSGGANWAINYPSTLTPGTHTIEVMVKGQYQNQCGITIDNSGNYDYSTLTVTFLKN
jgi:hypothetical protein